LRHQAAPLAGTPGVPSLRPSIAGLGHLPRDVCPCVRSTGHLEPGDRPVLRSRRWPVAHRCLTAAVPSTPSPPCGGH